MVLLLQIKFSQARIRKYHYLLNSYLGGINIRIFNLTATATIITGCGLDLGIACVLAAVGTSLAIISRNADKLKQPYKTLTKAVYPGRFNLLQELIGIR